jgi:hypothetical protein
MNNHEISLERYKLYDYYGKLPRKTQLFEDGRAKPQEPLENIGKIYQYNLNSDGLRTLEFSEKPEVLALGCSLTFGTGLPEHHTWPNLLKSMIEKNGIDYKVGTIAYNGGSIMQSISAMFSIIHKYEYTPKYILCNFPEIERFYFIKPEKIGYSMAMHTLNDISDRKTLSADWVYYINFEYIKMLEAFCESNNIKLVWSFWGKDPVFDEYCLNNFKSYKIEKDRDLFEPYPGVSAENYKMKDWHSIKCHEDLMEEVGEYRFNCAYDDLNIPPQGFMPHYGVHRQQHWAEFFYKESGLDSIQILP